MLKHSTHINTISQKKHSIQTSTAHNLRSKPQTGTVNAMPGCCLSQGIGENLPSRYEVASQVLTCYTQKCNLP